jgi:hypothetical protein
MKLKRLSTGWLSILLMLCLLVAGCENDDDSTKPQDAPDQPANLSPEDGAVDVGLTPTLVSSTFSDPNAGDTHTASQWKLTDSAGDYYNPVFASGTDVTNLTTISIPSLTLGASTTYYWTVRHQDDHGSWSPWSTETNFTTTGNCASLTLEGWSHFEAEDYASALSKFDQAISNDIDCGDAYNGRGWSLIRTNSLSMAISSFTTALLKGVRTPDPYAGEAVAYRDLEPADFERAIAAADSALGRDVRYVFAHDPHFDWRDLRLILAQCHFATSRYEMANAQIDSLGGDVQDPGSDTFVEDLLEEIQRLVELLADE